MRLSVAIGVCLACSAFAGCSSNKSAAENPANQIMGGSASGQAQAYATQPQTGFQTDAKGFRINSTSAPANQTYYFSFDSSKMRPQDLAALTGQANFLSAHPNAKIKLEGNTDNRGSREYNIALGWRRDQSVARIMEQQGVNPQQIDMVSYGKERPVAFGNDEQSWALNRRVNLVYEAN